MKENEIEIIETKKDNNKENNNDNRLFAFLAHISPLFIGILGPLLIWLLKKEESSFIEKAAKEALNFQILILSFIVCSSILTFITFGIAGIILLPLGFIVSIAEIVLIIMASVKVYSGEEYKYPINYNFIK